jgi:hypothetical protein
MGRCRVEPSWAEHSNTTCWAPVKGLGFAAELAADLARERRFRGMDRHEGGSLFELHDRVPRGRAEGR